MNTYHAHVLLPPVPRTRKAEPGWPDLTPMRCCSAIHLSHSSVDVTASINMYNLDDSRGVTNGVHDPIVAAPCGMRTSEVGSEWLSHSVGL